MTGVSEQDLASDSHTALAAAQGWARKLGHGFVGTEHLVWGAWEASSAVKRAIEGCGARKDMYSQHVQEIFNEHPDWQRFVSQQDALAAVGVDVEAVRAAVEAHVGPGMLRADFGPAFTLRAGEALEEAVSAATSAARHSHATAAHIAAAALAEDEAVAVDALRRSGASVDAIRRALRENTL